MPPRRRSLISALEWWKVEAALAESYLPTCLESVSYTHLQWLQSYVTGDKVYCVYIAPDEKAVREHARQGGFPANRVSEVTTVIDPTTAK